MLATVLAKVQHKICFHACRKVRHAMLVFAPVDNSRLLLSMWWAEVRHCLCKCSLACHDKHKEAPCSVYHNSKVSKTIILISRIRI